MFYGYALLPREPYDISSIVAAYNCEADIKVPRDHQQYQYYRYSVDEWAHWDHQRFEAANRLLTEANHRFASMHTKEEGDYVMDEFEIAHSDSLLEGILQGLDTVRAEGVFGTPAPFLAMWISDSGHAIMEASVRRLNSEAIAREFMAEFG